MVLRSRSAAVIQVSVLYTDCTSHKQARPNLVDATRMSDNKLVYIKRVTTGDKESSIACMLSSESLRNDSRNHSVPILDVFVDDEDPGLSYLVMPFLRYFNSPEFQTVGEVVDFVGQVLEVWRIDR